MHEATCEAMLDPQPGDLFSELCVFWIYVAHREDNVLTLIETSGPFPCTLPDDGLWSTCTAEQFRARFSYSSTPGYWVRLMRRGDPHPIAWFENKKTQRGDTAKSK